MSNAYELGLFMIGLHRTDAVYCYEYICRAFDVCVLGTPVSPAETDELIEMSFGGTLTWAKGTMY